MNRLAAVLLTILFALVGCSSNSDDNPGPEPTVTVTATPEPSSPEPEVTETPTPEPEPTEAVPEANPDAFVAAVQSEPWAADVPADVILDLGKSICSGFDSGLTFEQIAQNGVDAGFTPYQSGFLIGASVAGLCPENLDKLPDTGSGTNA